MSSLAREHRHVGRARHTAAAAAASGRGRGRGATVRALRPAAAFCILHSLVLGLLWSGAAAFLQLPTQEKLICKKIDSTISTTENNELGREHPTSGASASRSSWEWE